MYAVIETGGKQYRVELGTELAIERLDGAPGDTINFDRVLLVADGDNSQIGTPVVADALVSASVVRQDRGEKVIVFKYRPKARHRAKKGHRQEQTVIRVADIRFSGRSAADEAGALQKEDSKVRKAAAAEAQRRAAADQALAVKLAEEAAAKAAQDKAAAEKLAKPKPAAPVAAKAKPASTTSRAQAKTPAAAPKAKPATKPTTKPAAKAAPAEPKPSTTTAKPPTTRAKATRPSTKRED